MARFYFYFLLTIVMKKKPEIIASVAEKANVSKKVATDVVNSLLEIITEELEKGEPVQLIGFGTFSTKERPERQGRNIRTGETITVPATRFPAFKAGNQLKNAVKESK